MKSEHSLIIANRTATWNMKLGTGEDGMKHLVILITGVTSGIGKAMLERLSRDGHRVYGCTRSCKRYYELNEKTAGAEILELDITDEISVKRAVATIVDKEKRIDVLINNAGYGLAGAVECTPVEEAKYQFEVNLFGTMRMTKAVLPVMRKKSQGLIINMSSIVGKMGIPYQALYCASKHAVEGFSESLRMELKEFGISVVMLEPGDVKTSFTDNRVKAQNAGSAGTYKSMFEKSISIVEGDERKGMAPEKIAALVSKIILKKTPRLRYPIGPFEQMISLPLKNILPQRLFEGIIMQHLKL